MLTVGMSDTIQPDLIQPLLAGECSEKVFEIKPEINKL